MKIYVDNTPENCNNCIFKQNMSQHWDLNDGLNQIGIKNRYVSAGA